MKTLFPLTSRGRVRVFFNGPNKLGGTEGRNNTEEDESSGRVRNALAALVFAMSGTGAAYAQAPGPTQVASATGAPGSGCKDIKDRAQKVACWDNIFQKQDRQLADLLAKKQELERILAEQQVTIARLNAEALGDVHAFWSGYAPVIRALGLDANGLREYFKGWGMKLDNVLSVVVKNRFGDWELAQDILSARAGQ